MLSEPNLVESDAVEEAEQRAQPQGLDVSAVLRRRWRTMFVRGFAAADRERAWKEGRSSAARLALLADKAVKLPNACAGKGGAQYRSRHRA